MTVEKKEERVVMDLRRPKDAPPRELKAELIIEIDLLDRGYQASYYQQAGGDPALVTQKSDLDRSELVACHVEVIQQTKPKTVLVRSGRHSSGHIRDVLMHPGVIKSIIEGKLGAEHLLPRG